MTIFQRVKLNRCSWWRHQMETFSVLLAICAGNSPVPGEFPAQRPVMRSFDVFFDLRPNKRLSKQSWCWWFETPSRPLWRHCNVKLGPSGRSTTSVSDVFFHVMASQITGNSTVYPTTFFRANNKENGSYVYHCCPLWVDAPHKEPAMRKMCPCHDVIMD